VGDPVGPGAEAVADGGALSDTVGAGADGDVTADVAVDIGAVVAVGVLVDVAGVTGVGEGPRVGVRDGVRVRDGVGLGPGVRLGVGVRVLEGVRVEVGVALGPGVFVDVRVGVLVRVGVFVRVAVAVAEGTGVLVDGGARTVKLPLTRVSGTGLADGSEATALPSDRLEVPGAAPPMTVNETVASVPSGIAELPPCMTSRNTPADGWEELSDFPTDPGPLPRLTPPTERRLASKPMSKLTAETWAPPWDDSVTPTATPVAPGAPEPEPIASVAPGDWAEAMACGPSSAALRSTPTRDRRTDARLLPAGIGWSRSESFMGLRPLAA
jgi:hypothetical protein